VSIDDECMSTRLPMSCCHDSGRDSVREVGYLYLKHVYDVYDIYDIRFIYILIPTMSTDGQRALDCR